MTRRDLLDRAVDRLREAGVDEARRTAEWIVEDTTGATRAALYARPDVAVEPAEAALKDEPPLVLSTIHSAKGLEFEAVFLIHALDGVLPSQYALASSDEEDEERRLLYVALTRAETELYCSLPLVRYQRGQGQFVTEPSRFLSGLPESLLEPWSLVEGAAEDPGTDRALTGGGRTSLPSGELST